MNGYDAPVSTVAQDVLGRASFASGIAQLAVDTPAQWGVRIGVYGRWGEGKSSVLQMVARELRADGHLVAEFNPWGCATPEEMVELLADTLVKGARAEALPIEGRTARTARKGAKLLAKAAEMFGGDPGKTASPWLSRWAQDRQDDINKVVSALGDARRLVVLVDDVDRVDPKVLPRLLFALHEVFSFPGVSFILALDPDVVGSALAEYHAGFKSGLEFLEKIVQFPRWLPAPSKSALARLAERERTTFAEFLRPDVLAQRAAILPENPRELRSLIRGLACLADELERHDPDELDQHLLLLLEVIRQASPRFLAALLEREDLLNMSLVAMARNEKKLEFEAKVGEFAAAVAPEKGARVTAAALDLCGTSIHWTPENIRYHAYLAERPHAVTWREFRELLKTESDDARRGWVEKHAHHRRVSVESVVHEIRNCCSFAYQKSLTEAAATATEDGNRERIEHASRVLAVLEWVWFRFEPGVQTRTPEAFLGMFQAFQSWARFTRNDADQAQRVQEHDLIVRATREASPALEYLEALAPWDPRHEWDDKRSKLSEAVLADIEERASNDVMSLFETPSGIVGGVFGARHAVTVQGPEKPDHSDRFWNRDRHEIGNVIYVRRWTPNAG